MPLKVIVNYIFFFLSVIIIGFLFNSKSVYASSVYFQDNFDSIREYWIGSENWKLVDNDLGNKSIEVNFAEKRVFETYFPSDSQIYDLSDYIIEVKMYGKDGVDQDVLIRVASDQKSYYFIDLRANAPLYWEENNIRIVKVIDKQEIDIFDWAEIIGDDENINFKNTWMEIQPERIGCSIYNNKWYSLRVEVSENKFNLFIKCPDSTSFYEVVKFKDISVNPLSVGGIGLASWSGTYPSVSEGREMIKSFDDVLVRSVGEPNLTSEGVVVVPGLSASWNTKAMVLDQEVDQSEWKLIPFAKPVYQRLYHALEQNGYTTGEDLFLWPYDWRQPISESADDLAFFIENTDGLKTKDKINLIGHSLGGMVSRQWAKDNQNKVGKIVTVGSPHQGAVQAYQALAGGKIGEQRDLEWIGMELLVHINRRGFQIDAAVIQNFAPVLYDLTPSFDYLFKDGQMLSSNNGHNFINNYLIDLNADPVTNTFINQTSFIAGNMPDSTPEQLNLNQTNLVDKLLNLWPDGKPIQTLFGVGDQTVLRSSSYLGNDNPLEFPLEHKELVHDDQPLEEILKEIGISNPVIPTLAPGYKLPSASDMLIFYLASPAVLEVEDLNTGQTYTPEEDDLQMVYIDHPQNPNDYLAKLTGIADGTYHLYLGQLTPQGSYWQTYQGEISLSQEKEYLFEIKPNQPEEDPLVDQTGKNLLELALFELRKLNDNNAQVLNTAENNISSAIDNVDSQNWLDVIAEIKNALDNLSEYRKKLLENEIAKFNHSLEISRLLVSAWQKINQYHLSISKQDALNNFKKAVGYSSLGKNYLQLANDRNQDINKLKPASLKLGEAINGLAAEETNQYKYFLAQPDAYFGINLGQETYFKNPSRVRQPR